MAMTAVVVCVSVSHGNTAQVAGVIAEELSAEVLSPDTAIGRLGGCDLLGVGSGIFGMAFHPRLGQFVTDLPGAPPGARAFVFWTSGMRELPLWSYRRGMSALLEAKGYEVVGSFSCPGWDTWWPLRLIGGRNKGRPDHADLEKARQFGRSLRQRFGDQRAPTNEPTA
jgi:flavodoxin